MKAQDRKEWVAKGFEPTCDIRAFPEPQGWIEQKLRMPNNYVIRQRWTNGRVVDDVWLTLPKFERFSP